MPEGFSGDIVSRLEICHRNADQYGDQCGDQADLQAVPQCLVIILLLEEPLEIVERHSVRLGGEEAVHHQRIEGIYQEQQENDEDQDFDPEPEILIKRLALFASQHESTSLDSFS